MSDDDKERKRLDRLRKALAKQARKSKGNPPKDWAKKHPRPKKKNGDK